MTQFIIELDSNQATKNVGTIGADLTAEPLQMKLSAKSALQNRNLQLYFGGQVISIVGTWMQQMALSWLIYRLTGSPFMLGLVGFSSQAPALFFSPLAGILADRVNRHRLVVITQLLMMAQAGLLAILVYTGHAQLWQLVVLSSCLGIISAFDLPTRQSFLVDMLDDHEQLASAIGINSSINTMGRFIGPFIAGLVVAWAGEAVCFSINALSYIAVIIALAFIKAKQPAPKAVQSNALSQLKEGFNYTIGFPPIRDLIMLLAMIGLCVMPFSVLLPAFARDVFHGNASTLGFLTGASGAGSVIGALFLTSRKGTADLSRWIITGCALSGVSLMAFGFSTIFPLSLLAVIVVGFSSMIAVAGSNTVIQTIVDKDKRGRVMSFVIMAFMGLSPFGCMAAGAVANSIGVGKTVVAAGLCTLLIAFIFASRVMRIHATVTEGNLKEGVQESELELAVISKK